MVGPTGQRRRRFLVAQLIKATGLCLVRPAYHPVKTRNNSGAETAQIRAFVHGLPVQLYRSVPALDHFTDSSSSCLWRRRPNPSAGWRKKLSKACIHRLVRVHGDFNARLGTLKVPKPC